ncbi:MAG: glycosyltransferase family 39 protein [bacterium]|nr:glycosyltransferase family 39 protein [bacterium]
MKKALALVIVMILFAGLRIIHLSADAPIGLSWGRGPFTDEGFYAHNARNKILFDNWSMDDYNYHFVSPVMSAINYIAFKSIGLKYGSMRVCAVFFSLLTLFLIFNLVRKKYDYTTALMSGFMIIFSYFYLMYNRLFISEIPMLFFLILALFFIDQGKKRDFYFAGMCFVLALLSKSLALHFMAVIAWMLWRQRHHGMWPKAGLFFAGVASVAVFWWVSLVWPDPEKFFNFYHIFISRISPKHISQVYKVFNAEYFAYAPALTTGALLVVRWYREFGELDKVAGVWLVAGIVSLMLFSYTTTAYYLILFVPTVLLVCGFLYRFRRQLLVPVGHSFWFSGIWLFSAYFIFRYIMLFYFRDLFFQSLFTKLALELITVLIITGLWKTAHWIVKFKQRNVIIVLSMLFLVLDFAPYLEWAIDPHFVVQETMRDLQTKVPQGTIAGSWAPALCLETNLREFPFDDTVVNTGRLKTATSLTHLLLERREEDLGFIQKNHASLLAHSKIIATYYIDNKIIDLWKLSHD